MNSRILDLYATYKRRPTNDLVDLAKRASHNIYTRLKNSYNFSENSAAETTIGIASKFFFADGKIADNEYALLVQVFTGSVPNNYDIVSQVREIGAQYDERKIKAFLANDSILKQYCAELGFAICAIDGQISIKEEDFLDYLTD